ncbi:MAG: hypothetical protein ABIR16_01150 [Dokdonella sp.]
MLAISKKLLMTAGQPDKSGGYAEPKPDPKRGDDAENSFYPEYQQGREPKTTPSEPEHEKQPHDKS